MKNETTPWYDLIPPPPPSITFDEFEMQMYGEEIRMYLDINNIPDYPERELESILDDIDFIDKIENESDLLGDPEIEKSNRNLY